MKLFYATKNKAKIYNMRIRLKDMPIELLTPYDLNIDIEVDEDGNNTTENALKKARAYFNVTGLPTIAGDTGLYITNLCDDKQPTLNVRRVNGKYLNDEEMLNYYIDLLKTIGGESEAYYTTSLALIIKNKEFTIKIDEDKRILTTKKCSLKWHDGDPLDIISIDPKTKKYYIMLTPEELTNDLIFGKKCIEFIKDNLLDKDI